MATNYREMKIENNNGDGVAGLGWSRARRAVMTAVPLGGCALCSQARSNTTIERTDSDRLRWEQLSADN